MTSVNKSVCRLTASCYLKGGRSKNLNFDTHKPKQPQKRKFPSSPNQSTATTTGRLLLGVKI